MKEHFFTLLHLLATNRNDCLEKKAEDFQGYTPLHRRAKEGKL